MESSRSITSRIADYAQLAKMRLSLLVLFSAVAGFVIASPEQLDWARLIVLVFGGFLVTASSNAFNQVLEKDTDKLMDRTAARPLAAGRMFHTEGFIVASVMGLAGVSMLAYFLGSLCGFLGLLSLLLYVLAYTPLKKESPFAVFVGAIPGAMPPLLGWVAATGTLDFGAWILYSIQFIWQFPHFWALAWVLDEDYKKAGFRMLPSGERNRASAFQALAYSIGLIPIGFLPFVFNMVSILPTIIIAICSLVFAWQALSLYRKCTVQAAQRLMYGSFMYLPLVQIALMADRFL